MLFYRVPRVASHSAMKFAGVDLNVRTPLLTGSINLGGHLGPEICNRGHLSLSFVNSSNLDTRAERSVR